MTAGETGAGRKRLRIVGIFATHPNLDTVCQREKPDTLARIAPPNDPVCIDDDRAVNPEEWQACESIFHALHGTAHQA